MAVGRTRAVSHGFLLILVLGATLYLGLSARNIGKSPALPWYGEAVSAFSSDGYFLRPASEVYPFALPYGLLKTGGASQETRTGSNRSLVDGDREGPSVASAATSGSATPDPLAGQEARTGAAAGQTGPVTYEVSAGDTVSMIAECFGISTETILWANNLVNADFIRLGQSLVILPVSGVLHVVEKGDTLLYLASKYGVDTEEIVGYQANDIPDPNFLAIGQKLIIPGGTMPVARAASSTSGGARPAAQSPAPQAPSQSISAAASGSFAWPNPGRITQGFSGSHSGLDIAAPYGTPVVASDSGVVVVREALNWGLGWYVAIDHGNGYSTTYAHLSSFVVGIGERVGKGDMVGRIGSTGLSTGPHNHFVVRRYGVPINPLSVLP